MDLNTIWFTLITILFVGFFFLEGFDYGVGTLLPFIAREDRERRLVINSIGTFWDGNEVWLLTAGGAMFAAFPHWYATMFSGFYIALVLVLLALIVRGVGFEFRSKDEAPGWRRLWDWMIFIGSSAPALLFGVAVGNLLRGVKIDAKMTYVGSFLDLLNPFSLLTGVTFLVLFALHGALFLQLRLSGRMLDRARRTAVTLWIPTVILAVAFLAFAFTETHIFKNNLVSQIMPAVAALALVATGFLIKNKPGWAFGMTGLTIAAVTVSVFASLYPNVMISTLNPEWNLTIHNASSSPYTLRTMSLVALIFVPIMLAYQIWTYWIFRKRLTDDSKLEY